MGSGRRKEGNKGPSLIVGVTFCMSGETSCQSGLKRASPSGSWMADEAAKAQCFGVNPHFESEPDLMLAVLGDKSASHPLFLLCSPPCLSPLPAPTHCPEDNRTWGWWEGSVGYHS